MKIINKALLFGLFAILSFGCKRNDLNGTWLYSNEYGGRVYTGLIYDFENFPKTSYLLLNKKFCDTINIKGSGLFVDTTGIGTVVWKNKNCFVLKYYSDSLVFHRIPNLHLADSIHYVLNILTSGPILYEDNYSKLTYYFDTTINDRNFYNSSILNLDNPTYGIEYSEWKPEIVNNSVVLLNRQPFSLFPKNLLITSITNERISGIVLGFPGKRKSSIVKAISANKYITFEYDSFSFSRMGHKTKEEISQLKEKLISRSWKVVKLDSAYISYGIVSRSERTRVFPKNLNKMEYNFYPDNKYNITAGDSLYTGQFDISTDGKYIILDKKMYGDNCVEVQAIDSVLRIGQFIRIQNGNRKYKMYHCKLELK